MFSLSFMFLISDEGRNYRRIEVISSVICPGVCSKRGWVAMRVSNSQLTLTFISSFIKKDRLLIVCFDVNWKEKQDFGINE